MERDDAQRFQLLKAELEEALREAEAGGFFEFDTCAFEPELQTGDAPAKSRSG